jgi:hypothetical protein
MPCGHAAHVDSVDFFASLVLAKKSTLPTIAWTAQRRPHDHKADDNFLFFS